VDIGKNITDSLRYPSQDWVKIIILAVISIIPIVNFMSGGYYLRIIKSTLAGLEEIPEFDDLVELFIDGIKLLIVGIIYFIIPFIFIVIGVALSAGGLFFGTLIFVIVGLVSFFLISIIGLTGVVNMAYYDSDIGAALRFHEIIERIKTIGWGNYISYIIVLWVILIVLGAILSLISGILFFIGFILAAIGTAYLIMFQARSVALIFAESEQMPFKPSKPKNNPKLN
jgi:hypothetical protein